ncbi:MAG: adenosine deaminase [Spirochaetia bacterium]
MVDYDKLDSLSFSEFTKLFKTLPKTEIHLHLEGMLTVNSIWSLIHENNITIEGIKKKADLAERFRIESLDEFIDLFINVIQACLKKPEDMNYLIKDARKYLKRNNIEYAEIFFAPTKLLKNGIAFHEMIRILQEGAERIWKEDKRKIEFILDVSRSYGTENAMNNLDLFLSGSTDYFLGIGLGGAEQKGPAEDYETVFQKAKERGLHLVAHAGEDVGPASIWSAVQHLHAERIGHGISAKFDENLMDLLAKKQIPLEICPTSNVFTRRYATGYNDHPIRKFYDRGIKVTVNTDDPTIFGFDLNSEYLNLVEKKVFSQSEIIKLLKNTVYSTFLSTEEKDKLWKKIATKIQKYIEKVA